MCVCVCVFGLLPFNSAQQGGARLIVKSDDDAGGRQVRVKGHRGTSVNTANTHTQKGFIYTAVHTIVDNCIAMRSVFKQNRYYTRVAPY